jgi:molybdenum cofactor biosynthesis enzyme MoaA
MRKELNLPIKHLRHTFCNLPSGYLRISITDQCNMKCSYCHNEGQTTTSKTFMSLAQLRDIVTQAIPFGLVKVRLTGGEPLLHKHCIAMLELLKCDLKLPTVGLNSNGIIMRKLEPIARNRLVDSLVIGLDYVDGSVSKDSTCGVRSEEILTNILKLQGLGQDVSIACVYDGDYDRIVLLIDWCIKHGIVLKILEKSDNGTAASISPAFLEMTRKAISDFSLELGEIETLSEYYGAISGDPKVYFFHSHCRLRECIICGKIHLRVTADCRIKSCIQEDISFPLVTDEFTKSLARVISNVGYPPETRQVTRNTRRENS